MLRPLGKNVLVEFDSEEQTTAGGIYIPDASRERPNEGTVVALGIDVIDDTKGFLREGDRVLITKYGGTDLKFDDKDYRLVTKDDILGVLE